MDALGRFEPAEVWLRRRAIVESEDALDDTVELGRNVDRSLPTAEGAAIRMVVQVELHAEGGADVRDGARQHDAAPARAALDNRQAMRPGERFYARKVGWIGAETVRECLASEVVAGLGWLRRELVDLGYEIALGARAYAYGDFYAFVRVWLADGLSGGYRLLLATPKDNTVLRCHEQYPPRLYSTPRVSVARRSRGTVLMPEQY